MFLSLSLLAICYCITACMVYFLNPFGIDDKGIRFAASVNWILLIIALLSCAITLFLFFIVLGTISYIKEKIDGITNKRRPSSN